ncbi:F-type H+-transporting ATPase subunit b [Novosphingobium sp. Rr 2-17]|uniref:F0F1 ATP synthase subunit B family protein n=1 Tax=Novosphingobium sp. Rr 2-17 TaxID=555793 RepID=UPI0002699EF8|nr:ATP synthase subunit B [Novosphingobium sp. Rr 2-17]EIZ78456.1 F-type H+-transporting ATPase subunit b [Novosphingobium sp. Rr 2-17]
MANSVQTALDHEAAEVTGASAAPGVEHAGTEHAEPMLLGFAPPVAVVSTSMIVLLAILVWKGVPKLIATGLDTKIAEIKAQLAEAKTLRAEAEALRKEYADKIAGAEHDAAEMLDHARHEAQAIIAKAETDVAEVIVRRERMAQDKIGAAELAAVTQLRAQAAAAAAAAAKGLIASNHSATADKALVDQAIAGI